jgi:hypothetical protein
LLHGRPQRRPVRHHDCRQIYQRPYSFRDMLARLADHDPAPAMANQYHRLGLLFDQIRHKASPEVECDPGQRRSIFTHSGKIRGNDWDSPMLEQRRYALPAPSPVPRTVNQAEGRHTPRDRRHTSRSLIGQRNSIDISNRPTFRGPDPAHPLSRCITPHSHDPPRPRLASRAALRPRVFAIPQQSSLGRRCGGNARRGLTECYNVDINAIIRSRTCHAIPSDTLRSRTTPRVSPEPHTT